MSSAFVGFSAHHQQQHQQQHGQQQQHSPLRIGGVGAQQHQQQQHQQQLATSKQQQPAPPSGAEQLQRLTHEYQEEAARLAEQLSLCGIQQHSLSFEALTSLKLLVQLACALQVTQASPQVLLAAWAMLLVRHSKATTMQHKLRHELSVLAHKRATAQQKQAVLQRILCDVQSAQHKEAVRAQQLAKQTRQAAEKEASYKLNMEKMTHKLEKNGFTPQLKHSALLEKHSELQAMQQQLADLQEQLNSYHQLPATLLGARMKLDDARQQLRSKEQHMKSQMVADPRSPYDYY